LTGLGYSIISLAILVGIGIVMLVTMGNSIGGTGNTTLNTIVGYLGTSSGGLASWIPLIIIAVIGIWFLGMFMGRKGGKY
jgi:multisubunit Na+/H+ antiporter MnhB subunit